MKRASDRKGNVRLEAGENTNITSTENKFSSASVGASFTPQGLSNISINANKANGNSKETLTAYSPTLVVAENNLSLSSGKDMDIIGSKAQGEKITAKVGGNLNIETLQEKETYEEQNSSTGFGFSWGVKAKDKQTSTKSTGQTQNPPTTNATKSTPKPNNTKVPAPTTGRKFFAPTIGASWNKGNIDSHYRSAREQAGFFAGSGGFDIYVEKNTDLKGGIIASNATPDKNHLSTGTFSFSDLKNEADYSAKSIGASYHKYGNYDDMTKDEQDKVYNTKGLAPVLPMPVVGSADSTTKSAVAPATIDIRENPTQDISALSRDTVNALNELGRIFDKQTMEERQELAAVFGEEAFRLLHNMKDNGSVGKIAAHAAVAGILSQITGNGFASGAAGAGLNEALINNLKGLDPGLAQMISGLLGAAAAKVAGRNALAGASAAISGTKWNLLSKADYDEMTRRLDNAKTDAERQAIKEEYQEKNKAQEENEQTEREALIRERKSSDEIADFFNNKRYPNYRTINGDLYLRTGDINITAGTTSAGTVATSAFTAVGTADGTPYIRAELRNPTPEEETNWFWHRHASKGISSFFLGPLNTAKIAITGTDLGGFYALPGERVNAKQEFVMGLITSVIPTGGGTLKALSALKIENPLLNITYTPKVMRQMTQDIYHGFPKSVEGFGHYGIKKKIVGNDGVERTLIEIPGAYNGKEGIFEFIIENDGITCNHRFFRVIDK